MAMLTRLMMVVAALAFSLSERARRRLFPAGRFCGDGGGTGGGVISRLWISYFAIGDVLGGGLGAGLTRGWNLKWL
jgi:hypothetical protein